MRYAMLALGLMMATAASAGISDFMTGDLKESNGYVSSQCSKNGFECICKDIDDSERQWICYMHDASTGYCGVFQSQLNGGIVPDQDCKFFKNAKSHIKIGTGKKQ